MLKRVQSVYYTVKDMDRAVSFYEGVFGLKLKFRDGARWAQIDGGNVSFALSSPEESASLEGGAVAGDPAGCTEPFSLGFGGAGLYTLEQFLIDGVRRTNHNCGSIPPVFTPSDWTTWRDGQPKRIAGSWRSSARSRSGSS